GEMIMQSVAVYLQLRLVRKCSSLVHAIFSSGAETEEFFYRLGLKDGLNLKNTVKSVLEMIS
ncbi:hypothetical protein KQI13_12685, partial [Anaerostipes hadrus]|nr:hypothetical protein [Anaerostipes hadrus]